MNIQKINSTEFGARLHFRNQQIQSAALPIRNRRVMSETLKKSILFAEKRLITLLAIFEIIKRIKNIKNSVKFPELGK